MDIIDLETDIAHIRNSIDNIIVHGKSGNKKVSVRYVIKHGVDEKPKEVAAVKDTLYGIHILFFFLGLVHFVPYTFFITATDYWMYKFRNISMDVIDSESRTVLQRQFAPINLICSSMTGITCTIIITLVGHKITVTKRIVLSFIGMITLFVISTVLVKVDTDDWQLEFFIATMTTIAIINICNSVLAVTLFGLTAKFPHTILTFYLLGEGVAGIFNSLIQIISLSVGVSSEVSALVYFITGSTVIIATFLYFLMARNFKCFKHNVTNTREDTKRDILTLSEIKEILKQLWPIILTDVVHMLHLSITSPSITALVVSEYAGTSTWADIYFVPVVTYLLSNVSAVIGRVLGSRFVLNGVFILGITVIKSLVFVPLIMLSNAQPRRHLPVILNHDYMYMLVVSIGGIISGYIGNANYLNIPKLIPKKDVERAFSVIMLCYGVMNVAISPLGSIFVELL